MRFKSKIAAMLLGLAGLPAAASAAVIGGTYYAPQYDFREFFAATDGRTYGWIKRKRAAGVPAARSF